MGAGYPSQHGRTQYVPPLKTYDLFISHAWTYNDEYYRLIGLLNTASNFTYRNYSVPEHDPLGTRTGQQLWQALERQIRPVNCVLVLAGMYANHRDWMKAEIEIAQSFGKPIVGIKPRGQQRTPVEVQNAAKTMVGWTTASIVQAIRAYSI